MCETCFQAEEEKIYSQCGKGIIESQVTRMTFNEKKEQVRDAKEEVTR